MRLTHRPMSSSLRRSAFDTIAVAALPSHTIHTPLPPQNKNKRFTSVFRNRIIVRHGSSPTFIRPNAHLLLSRSPTAMNLLQRQAFSRLLLSSPPALRSEVARLALSQAKFSTAPGIAGATALRAFGTRSGSAECRSAGYIISGRVLGGRAGIGEVRRFASTTTSAVESETPPTTKTEGTTAKAPRSAVSRALTRTALILFCLTAGFAMSAAPAADTVNGYLNPPTDEETLSLFNPSTPTAAEINEHILTHPLAVALRAQENVVESRPHMKIPPAMRPHNLTGGTLLGEGKIEVPPLNFSSRPGEELPTLVQIVYLGKALCGHPGIIHGGLLATLLDEGLARACFPALPNKVGVTASLKIDYRVPCPAESYVVLKAETTKVEGRKAWVKGWIEVLGEDGEGEGQRLVEAEALFVEPKGAKSMARVYSSQ